ncbi:MAG: transglycosylase [Gallionellales bacterium CG_4_10_14_3_um_filter_54_96]|nr:MAG: transglycosylase [Gallionellales bacterium CG17_big_fil_post_rev_8_21_14_2_50_54_146]PIY06071.1 MAG: transglycosylase [Gallionellales bacterium CG_4_10_14_3_um_filter_54_96]PJC03711.1 MAG: transglycosylase [Gallionellales bacterium CG_4_9_14_0_8_um_filter_55_61]
MKKSGLREWVPGARKTRPAVRLRPQTASAILKALSFYLILSGSSVYAGGQVYTPLSASVRAVLQHSVSDQAAPKLAFSSQSEANAWLTDMSRRLEKRLPDTKYRTDFLYTVHYEATRAGLDPQLVLGLIEVESGFKKYAVSSVGARGYMQVMPFWVNEIGTQEQNLFHLRTNLRYGCTILRHYLDRENGDLFRALGRYNGSLGRPEYPNLVRAAWHGHWLLPSRSVNQGYLPAS